jgi:hypothetical protein
MMLAIAAALLAAIFFGAGAALEQRQAATAPASFAGLLIVLARRPLWLLGLAAQFGGFVLHAVALRFGPLAIVQILVTPSLIVSVVLLRIWSRQPLSRASWAAAAAVVAGVAAFTALTMPTGPGPRLPHGPQGSADQSLAAVAVAVLEITALALAIAGRRARGASALGPRDAVRPGTAGRLRAALLAVAASLSATAMAVVTAAFVHVITRGPVAVAMSWQLYTLVVAGIGGVLLTQTAYQAGHPLITLPAISAVTPAASVAIGWGILGETVRLTPASEVGAALAALITSVALAALARSAPLLTSTLG